MNTDALKYQIANEQFLGQAQGRLASGMPEALTIEPVQGGFIVSGYFAGSYRRCVVNGIPRLLRQLRQWWDEVKPERPLPKPNDA